MEIADPGNTHGVPYMVAATGIGYNVDKIKKILGPDFKGDSWSLIFDPAIVAKLKECGVSLLDTPTEVFPAALIYAGKNGASADKADLNFAADQVLKIRPFIKYFHSSKYINDLANGDTCVAHGYVGDLVQARTRAAEKYQVNATDGDAVYIADSVRDVEAARMGGAASLAVASGRSTAAELRQAGADAVVADLTEPEHVAAEAYRLTRGQLWA